MLGTVLVIGATGLAGSFIAMSDSLFSDGAEDGESVETLENAEAEAVEEGHGDFLDMFLADAETQADAGEFEPTPPVVRIGADQTVDNFDPETGRIELLPPEGFDADEADVTLLYHPDFHETEVSVTGEDGTGFSVYVSGLEPEALGPENLSLAA